MVFRSGTSRHGGVLSNTTATVRKFPGFFSIPAVSSQFIGNHSPLGHNGMADSKKEQGEEWDDILNNLRHLRQQVQDHGPLEDDQRAEAADAFRQGFAHLEEQLKGLRGSMKGSSGHW